MTEINTEAVTETATTAKNISLPVFYGLKSGMTRIFDEAGNNVPVTVIKLISNHITQVKTKETDGYEAYQIGYGEKREALLNNPTKGHLKKAKVNSFVTKFAELRLQDVSNKEVLGQKISLNEFPVACYVDVTSTSKGKGFQGVVKRYGFAGGPASHGSHFHRRPGSIGNRATPARIFPQKKLPGHMGDRKVTVQNLKVIAVNEAEGYMLIKGSIPGATNSVVKVSKAFKKK
ncbi:MAG: 50S ribosomal protein L3 [Bacteriovoracaceae bacterium]|nr:50S ribosomal protein L3 [Bacteriovoracaceae bacterium]